MLLLPNFHLPPGGMPVRASLWSYESTPSAWVGFITEVARSMSGSVRSDHPSHSALARGPGAAEFVAGHRSMAGDVSGWDILPW